MSAPEFVTIKGSPYRFHLKREGAWEALCGAKPGEPRRGSSHSNRTGWNHYVDTFVPHPESRCAKCVESYSAMGGVLA